MEQTIVDFIIRIQNGYMSKKQEIISPHSKFRAAVAENLKELGYIGNIIVNEEKGKKQLQIELLYVEGEPKITKVQIMSRPGRRWYVSYKGLKPVINNYGCSLLSTPKGILTNREAQKEKVGGELLFSFW